MDARKFIWTAEKESALIDFIQERPALWNPINTNYSKKTFKKLMYESVCEEMAKRWPEDAAVFTATFIQAKFCSLRSYFQREDRKTKVNSGAAGFDFVPKWVHYRHLLFLKDCSMVAPSESSLDTSIVEDESEDTLTLCESQLGSLNGETSTSLPNEEASTGLQAEETCENEPTNTFPIYGGPPKKKRKRTETDNILAAATSALKSLGSRQDQQSSLCSSIGQVVTHTLESLNGQQQQKCMSEIFSLLAKYTAPES